MANENLTEHEARALVKPVRALTKGKKRREANAALDEAYADADIRDAGYCWVTGRYTQSGAVDARARREHHHLKGRRIRPEWITDPNRIITVCAEAHQLITANAIVVEGTDARKAIRFHWAAHVKPSMRTFQIKSRRSMHGGGED